MPELGDKPIEPRFLEQMNMIASALDEIFNDGPNKQIGFVLMVFPYNEAGGGRCNYISNGADRRDVVALMKEMIARFEGQSEMKGKA